MGELLISLYFSFPICYMEAVIIAIFLRLLGGLKELVHVKF